MPGLDEPASLFGEPSLASSIVADLPKSERDLLDSEAANVFYFHYKPRFTALHAYLALQPPVEVSLDGAPIESEDQYRNTADQLPVPMHLLLQLPRISCGPRFVTASLFGVSFLPLTQASCVVSSGGWLMSGTLGSLSTFGLTPTRQMQVWSDALTDLCGRFDFDPLESSTFIGCINQRSVSRLKLCQIEATQHRIGHTSSRLRQSEHPFVKILFQTHGISHFEQDGRRIDIAPGDCLVYDVSCSHTIVSPAFTRHDVVIVPKDMLHERGLASANLQACKLSSRNGTGRIAHDFMQATFSEAGKLSPNNAIGVADSLIDLLLLPLREADLTLDRAGPEAMYVRAQGFIREHLRNPELSIDQISAALPCTKRYLHMLFSERGMTVSDHIWQARLQHCRQELELQRGKTITDVAFSWGFSSSSHFSRMFRKYFGVAPSAIHRAQHTSPPAIAEQV